MFRLDAFMTTRLRTPQGFTHHCTNVHTTPPKTEGTKQESNPCLRITTQLVLPELYQRHQASVRLKQGPSLPLITAITLLEQRRAFFSQHAGPPCPSWQRDVVVKRACRQDSGLDWLSPGHHRCFWVCFMYRWIHLWTPEMVSASHNNTTKAGCYGLVNLDVERTNEF